MTSARHPLTFVTGFALATALTLSAFGQTSEPTPTHSQQQPAQRPSYGPTTTRVFYLKNLTTQQEANEVLTALRNTADPRDHITLVPSQNALVLQAPTENIPAIEKLLTELDQSKRIYRLTYTLIDLDGTKLLGNQHYAMVLVSGQRTVLKQGNKIPLVTGTDLKASSNPQSQITYLDIGMNFDATIDDAASALLLKTKVEQASVVEDRTNTLAQNPIVRDWVFEGSATLSPGKPLIIGSLDISGTTRRIEIQVTIEPLTR